MTNKEKAAVRSSFYEVIENSLGATADVIGVEPVADGLLLHLANGGFAEVSVTVKDETKFSLEKARATYAEKLAKAADRAEKARLAAVEAEQKAVEKAAKAAQKAAEKESK
jgi:hypothetical protein